MNRIPIPSGAYMRYRKGGRYVFAKKQPLIVWTTKQPPKGQVVYTVAWYSGQGILQASGTYVQP
jgi:hypothetical protein